MRDNKKTLKNRVLERINRRSGSVILRQDVSDMGSDRQVSRALKALVEDNKLVKLGYGIYAKAESNDFSDKPLVQGGFSNACMVALDRLGIPWELSSAHQAYNAGLSQQVPVRLMVQLKKRFRRQLSYGRRKLLIEGKINAR